MNIVDTHFHLWDLDKLRYPWLDEEPTLNRSFLLEDYYTATENLTVEQMVMVQCECLPSQALEEAKWIAECAQQEPRLAGMVAFAPLEQGRAVASHLDQLREINPNVVGIRRLLQGEQDNAFCLQPSFIEGVGLLEQYDLPYDLCINWRHLPYVYEFAQQLPNVRMVIDHIAKPDIKHGGFDDWAGWMEKLAKLDHVHCKLSSLATEADQDNWTIDDLRPYVDHVLTHFGVEKCMYASDWPVCTLAADYETCVSTLQTLIGGLSESEQAAIFRENGRAFYRLPVQMGTTT
ncbi:amidohydrolase family protein [Pontibacter sp. G13]|uniref:amidohydrolase family protein n=1 Tax=Pontibacter sp. G13 TaxID=3074898 RepID=UPI00288B6A19|nr:amidohydrolase family protein [Pontibacter sp. G13]WNJ20082.1 amidohydrolase family protein [Pontibacter sp. G13]